MLSMEDFRSRSYGEGRRSNLRHTSEGPEIKGMQDLRSYSTSYTEYPTQTRTQGVDKSTKGRSGRNGSTSGWGLGDPDLMRKKRVASYKAYTVEGKLKGSLKRSFRWIKDTCNKLANGW